MVVLVVFIRLSRAVRLPVALAFIAVGQESIIIWTSHFRMFWHSCFFFPTTALHILFHLVSFRLKRTQIGVCDRELPKIKCKEPHFNQNSFFYLF